MTEIKNPLLRLRNKVTLTRGVDKRSTELAQNPFLLVPAISYRSRPRSQLSQARLKGSAKGSRVPRFCFREFFVSRQQGWKEGEVV